MISSNAVKYVSRTPTSGRLRAFSQEREALEICEQNRCGARVFRFHFAVFLQFVGNCGRQNVVKKFIGASFLGDDFHARIVELPDDLAMLDQASTQLQLGQNLARQLAQRLSLFKGELTRLE